MFYNIEITPWMHLTPDIQFISNPATAAASDNPADGRFSLVLGTRLRMWF